MLAPPFHDSTGEGELDSTAAQGSRNRCYNIWRCELDSNAHSTVTRDKASYK